jgi:hypothetical protein
MFPAEQNEVSRATPLRVRLLEGEKVFLRDQVLEVRQRRGPAPRRA